MSGFITNHRLLQQAICLLICFCAWRGPVPVLHDHQTLSGSEVQNRHANAFHDGQRIDEVVGLHWHLGFPEDVTGEQCPFRDEASSDLSLFACASAAISFESRDTLALRLTIPESVRVFISEFARLNAGFQPDETEPRSFLQSLLTKVPLSAVTGVCLV